eukprot:m.920561 g.920561  ORF g.920561 m.920561 type:complete len:166 (+) comp66743_c0_seq1:294-791(+)
MSAQRNTLYPRENQNIATMSAQLSASASAHSSAHSAHHHSANSAHSAHHWSGSGSGEHGFHGHGDASASMGPLGTASLTTVVPIVVIISLIVVLAVGALLWRKRKSSKVSEKQKGVFLPHVVIAVESKSACGKEILLTDSGLPLYSSQGENQYMEFSAPTFSATA